MLTQITSVETGIDLTIEDLKNGLSEEQQAWFTSQTDDVQNYLNLIAEAQEPPDDNDI